MNLLLPSAKTGWPSTRLGYRAGYHSRTLATQVAKLELGVPQVRDGCLSPELFERSRR